MSRTLIVLGLVLVAIGLLWPWVGKLPFGRLPGDILIERERLYLFIPLGTGLLISVVLSLFLWFLNR